jgi:glycosyltransferase involved in cell wall biosynthesis
MTAPENTRSCEVVTIPGNISRVASTRQRWFIITPEYPPCSGGVSDYTQLVALGLAREGDEVHVLGPAGVGLSGGHAGPSVYNDLGRFSPQDLMRAGQRLDGFARPRRLLVQWVPHGYGFCSANVFFCLWLWGRAWFRRDQIDIVVHEAFLPFREGSWRQDLVALVHRFMTAVLLCAVDRVWVTIPAWEAKWRPWAFGRRIPFRWLPVLNNIPSAPGKTEVPALRQRYLSTGKYLLGHFSTHGTNVTRMLTEILPSLIGRREDVDVILIGKGSEEFRDDLVSSQSWLAGRLHATGPLNPLDLSLHLQACDLMLQPYPDGISTRRSSAMAALAYGIPLITTLGHNSETFWMKSGAAIIVPASDTARFVDEADRLLADDTKRTFLKLRSQQLYSDQFDIRHVVGALRSSAAPSSMSS